jgi:excisionase family DNA binding protein
VTDPSLEPMQPLLLTKAEAARTLAVNVRQITRWIASGELCPVRLGRLVRFTQAELEAFVERHNAPRPQIDWPTRNTR